MIFNMSGRRVKCIEIRWNKLFNRSVVNVDTNEILGYYSVNKNIKNKPSKGGRIKKYMRATRRLK